MPNRFRVKCTECGEIHLADKRQGQFSLQTDMTGYSCGSQSFVEYPANERPVKE